MRKSPPSTDHRWRRPSTVKEAVNQILAVYDATDWCDSEAEKHREMLGLERKPLRDYSKDDLKVILADFEDHKMVVYQD